MTATLAPELQTARLLLRGHVRADFAACLALWTDPLVTVHIGGRPSTREEVWTRLLRYVGHWSVMGYGYWVVVEKATGRVAGEVGFADFQREMAPSFGDAPEAGWVLAPWAHGQGYATEAVKAALSWCDATLGPVRTVCMITPGNEPSQRVAGKCGYVEFGRTTYKGEGVVLFER